MGDKQFLDLPNQSISRKAFLKSAGRFSILFSLLGLGGFLFTRNTCKNVDNLSASGASPCGSCGQNVDCDLAQVEKYRAGKVQSELEK